MTKNGRPARGSGDPARRAAAAAATAGALDHDCSVDAIAAQIVNLANHRDDLEGAIAGAVAHARDHGLSWAHVGGLLGVSKQAAMKRYRGADS